MLACKKVDDKINYCVKMIAIISTKENKKNNISIAKHLENKGIETWNFWKDTSGLSPKEAYQQHLEQFSALIFLINKDALTDSFILSLYRQAFEQGKDIILFMQTRLDQSLPNWFFLENHDWINAYDVSFDTAVKALTDLVKEYLGEKRVNVDRDTSITSRSEVKSKSNKQSILIIIGILILLGVLYVILNQSGSNSKGSEKIIPTGKKPNPEQMLIGTWGLKDYYDDIQRSGKDLIDFQQAIANLKKNFRMTFYPDHTFMRVGFAPQVEKGYWSLDEQNNYLIISDLKKTGEDRLKILTLTENELIFEISSYISPQKVSVVRITLYKLPQKQQTNN